MFIYKRWFKLTLIEININLCSLLVRPIKVNLPAKPHYFINTCLKSDVDLVAIISDLTKLVPQFGEFVEKFNSFVNDNSLNVVTDSTGNLFVDVPSSMPENKCNEVSTRAGILDRLIKTQGESIGNLFQKGSIAESKFKANNPNYHSELDELRKSFQTFKDLYKH